MADYQIRGRMNLETGQFIGALGNASRALKDFEDKNEKANKKVGNFGRVLRTVATGALAAYVVKLGVDSVKAAQAAGAAQDRLRRLLLNTGGATEAQIGLLNQQAQALEALTVVSDDNITTVQSQLATFDLAAKEIATLTPAILDYVVAERGASASTDEFRSLTNGLAQAINGNFAALTRVGFIIPETDKKLIKSGTESERVAAIVRTLNTTYKDFAQTAGGTAAGAQIKLRNEIDNVKEAFGNALLPTIQKVQGFIATNLIPIFQDLQARFADGSSVQRFVDFISMLGKNIIDFGKAIIQIIGPVFTTVFVPVIKIAIGAVIALIKVIGAIGRFIQNNIKVFQVLAGVITAVAIGIGAYIVQVKLFNAVSKAMLFLTGAKTKATLLLTKAFKGLNLVMKMNPIGFIIAAVAALATGFVMLWNKSEAFRKLVITVGQVGLKAIAALIRGIAPFAEAVLKFMTAPIRGFLKVLSYIPGVGKYFKSALDVANKALDGTSEFLDKAADKVEGLANSLDKFSKKKVKAPKIEQPKVPQMPDFSGLPDSGKLLDDPKAKKAAAAAAKRLAELQRALKESVENYNEYIKGDFTTAFMNGSDAARDSVAKALDNLKDIFDAKAKMLSDQGAIDALYKKFDQVKEKIKPLVEQYAKVAQQIQDINAEIDKALDALNKAIADRAEAQKDINKALATPFGEPSEIRKSMAGAEASVDSIISSYDRIKDLVTKRFTGMPDEGRDMLINYFEAQTKGLVALAKRRVAAVKVLEKAQEDLAKVVEEQKDFTKSLQTSLREFGYALVDLSKEDSKSVYQVTKTATGYVISQTKKSTNAIDTITKQLQMRLKSITDFSSNINKLLASGLNETYIRQLLTAGPEAAGQTAAALTQATTEQIATINGLYKDIDTISTTFSTDMGTKFYQSAVDMATNFKLGAELGLELIDAVMNDIVTNISNVLGILGNTGYTNAKALVDALTAEFTRQANETVGPATQLVVDKIQNTLVALAKVGLSNAQALIDGLTVTLGAEDNKARYTASAEQIRANIDTILKLLAPNALTSGLGLINSLVTSMGGKSLTDIVAAATAIKDGVSAALDLLKGKGTQVAADLAQELYDKLLAEKARLVALAQSIAAAIAAALAGAAASIGVDIQVPEFPGIDPADIPPVTDDGDKGGKGPGDFRKADEDTSKDVKSASSAAKTAANAAKKTADSVKKTVSTIKKDVSPNLGNRPLGVSKATTPALNVGPAAPRGFMRTPMPTPSPKAAPLPQNTRTNLPSNMKSAPGATEIRNATVVVNTTKPPSASQIKNTVSGALKGAANAKKGK